MDKGFIECKRGLYPTGWLEPGDEPDVPVWPDGWWPEIAGGRD